MAFATLLLTAPISNPFRRRGKLNSSTVLRFLLPPPPPPGSSTPSATKVHPTDFGWKNPQLNFRYFFFDGFLNAFKLMVAGEKRGEGSPKIRAGFGLERDLMVPMGAPKVLSDLIIPNCHGNIPPQS